MRVRVIFVLLVFAVPQNVLKFAHDVLFFAMHACILFRICGCDCRGLAGLNVEWACVCIMDIRGCILWIKLSWFSFCFFLLIGRWMCMIEIELLFDVRAVSTTRFMCDAFRMMVNLF